MKAAFIVMSILGCDDNGAMCTPVAQVPEHWQTIAACDSASEKHLARYANVNHPMVVAVCQTAETTALADSTEDASGFGGVDSTIASNPQPPQDQARDRGMTSRAIQLVRNAIPTRKTLSESASYPLHVVTDTYSWVARKITN